MSLDELERWLQDRAERRPVAAGIPMLDGYVAAIVAGPASISPPDWICPLLGIDADATTTSATRSRWHRSCLSRSSGPNPAAG
jgi:uncharacterized protein